MVHYTHGMSIRIHEKPLQFQSNKQIQELGVQTIKGATQGKKRDK